MSVTNKGATEREKGIGQITVEWMTKCLLTQKPYLSLHKIETESHNNNKREMNTETQSRLQSSEWRQGEWGDREGF